MLADDASKSEALSDVVSFVGFQPRLEALRRVAAADCGLVILADDPGKGLVHPAKMFEYLGMDREVLAIVPGGEVEDLLGALGWGVVVRPEPDAIAAGIEAVFVSGRGIGPADPEGRFDRVALTRTLAAMLDEVASRRGAPQADA